MDILYTISRKRSYSKAPWIEGLCTSPDGRCHYHCKQLAKKWQIFPLDLLWLQSWYIAETFLWNRRNDTNPMSLMCRTKKMTKKKKKRPGAEVPPMRRLGSDLAHVGGDGAPTATNDPNTADEESKHRRKDYPHIHTPAKPHLLKQGSDTINQNEN